MTPIYRISNVYSAFINSSERAFGCDFDRLPLDGNLPIDYRKHVEEALSAMRRAKRISDIVIAKNKVEEKQQELKKAETYLKNLESPDYGKTECNQ